MKNILISSILFFTTLLTFGQERSKTYLVEGKSFKTSKEYSVNEITLYPDSTYLQKVYNLDDKEQRKNYRNFEYNLINGKFKRNGDFYIFKEIGADSVFNNHFKITDKKLTFYYKWKEKKLKRGGIFKRVKNDIPRTFDFISEITNYVYLINFDKDLSTSITTGVVEDEKNSRNKGEFDVYEHFYPDKEELVRVDYSANTNDELLENYYFQNSELIHVNARIQQSSGNVEVKEIYIHENKILYQSKSDYFKTEDLIRTGYKYLTEWKSRL